MGWNRNWRRATLYAASSLYVPMPADSSMIKFEGWIYSDRNLDLLNSLIWGFARASWRNTAILTCHTFSFFSPRPRPISKATSFFYIERRYPFVPHFHASHFHTQSRFIISTTMSGVNKETPVTVDEPTPATTTKEVEESKTESAGPTEVDASTPLQAVTHAASSAANTVSDKATKIFGSFTSSLPDTPTKKDESSSATGTPSKPLFGGFMTGTSSASAWSAPTTTGGFGSGSAGGFGSASSFTPKPAQEKEDNEEVSFLDLWRLG
jgi:hypothetical protein